jgi:Fe-S cluster assembly protein SufD
LELVNSKQMATEISSIDTTFRRAFLSFQERQSAKPWLVRLRENAFTHFEEQGFPTVRDEEWKYTNVAPLTKISFEPSLSKQAAPVAVDQLRKFVHPESEKSQLVLVNGVLSPELSDLSNVPSDVVAIDLSAAIEHENYGEIVREHIGRNADYVRNAFTALNTAFIGSSGVFIYIPRNVRVQVPLHVLFISAGAEPNSVTFPRVLVVAEESSGATIIESYGRARDAQYFTNAVIEVVLKSNSRIEHYKVQRESKDAFHVANTAVTLARSSSFDTTNITLGGQLSRHDISVVMDDEGAECWVDGLYIVGSGQHTDTHSVIDHRKPHCSSHQLYKGILDGKSRAVFNGKIFVRHDAQKTDAMQTNKNLLLSNEARVDTKPQLEILADDVKCAHGAAVGQIDEDELFYLETRGIHPDLARNLLTYGFAEEVIGKIRIDSIRSQLDGAVLNRLNARLEA